MAKNDLLSSDLDTEVNERQSNLLLYELEVGLLLLPVLQVVHQAGHLVQQALCSNLGKRVFSLTRLPQFTWFITLIGITRAYLDNITMEILQEREEKRLKDTCKNAADSKYDLNKHGHWTCFYLSSIW